MTVWKNFAQPGKAALAVLALYPFVIYFFLDVLGPGWLGCLLVAILAVRYRELWQNRLWLLLPAAIAALLFLLLKPPLAEQGLRYYPVAISLTLLVLFAASLLRGPTIIERFAAATGAEISPAVRRYTRRLTVVWCAFFCFNAVVSGTIAASADMQLWVLYNGVISYVLIGVLFGGEIIFRHFYMQKSDSARPVAAADSLPRILNREQHENRMIYQLTTDPGLKWFAGHFPDWPILPGVVQVNWAIVLAKPLGIEPDDFSGIPRVKFMSVIPPGLQLTLELEKTARGLRFKYTSAEGAHSQGSIGFG